MPLYFLITIFSAQLYAQQNKITDSTADSSQQVAETYLLQQREQQRIDSMISVQLQKELAQVATDSKKKKQLEDKLEQLSKTDSIRKAEQLKRVNELKQKSACYPVVLLTDTLFYIYTRIGSFSAAERAGAISERLKKLYDAAFFNADSLKVVESEVTYDIIYNNNDVIMSIAELDGLWYNETPGKLANNYLLKIQGEITKAKKANSLINWLTRIGYICLIILGICLIVYGVNRLFRYTRFILRNNRAKYFNGITIRKIQFLSPQQHYRFAMQANSLLRIIIIIFSLYLALPLLFSIFPQTKSFADVLWGWIITPSKAVLNGLLNFLPSLFTIVIIYIATRYVIQFVRYFATEIDKGVITINGFYKEWAWPTFNIVRFLIYAFMFVVIFPYLPGSGSPAFQGVTVFLGVLVSLGSSSAISNLVAGLVITYMRPFKTGDRVKIGEVVGDVVEKTMLVTRILTIKNEDVTVPNSTVLSGHTINYSTKCRDTGLIVHTTVTIGYDVPWKDIHHALTDAALRTDLILKEPPPFVLQTSLDDFYVSYQINAYTKDANMQAVIYSDLHKNIQDACNEKGIEIMSPHYNAMRDGNTTAIPPQYVAKDYKPPAFNVNLNREENQ